MRPEVKILHVEYTSPPVFRGSCNDDDIVIRLDTSAYMRLLGKRPVRSVLDQEAYEQIERSAARIIGMGANASKGEITVSALDLD